jgi:hypothetical protein
LRNEEAAPPTEYHPRIAIATTNSSRTAMLTSLIEITPAARDSSGKIGGFDPATAPLVTDNEAAGCPTHPVEEDSNPGGQGRRGSFRSEA